MHTTTLTEENYLKAIYQLGKRGSTLVSTNAIAHKINTKASSVTDMLKKLADKDLVNYEKYKGAFLTLEGKQTAINIIRKHRLWETFLVNKLKTLTIVGASGFLGRSILDYAKENKLLKWKINKITLISRRRIIEKNKKGLYLKSITRDIKK